ncbi:MAG: hypothetical protein CBC82_10325 [Cellvibrionales bacterium TMED122]|nr:MAG: hypothetical protein CBC82_10325 [Cellvibrionales bacterium TMED122]
MKLYINSAKENWVVDRFIEEWNKYNFKQSKSLLFGNKLVWLIAPWTWKRIPIKYLNKNKVLCTIHHIDEDKFTKQEQEEFQDRDQYVDAYHVISDTTFEQVNKLTTKPVHKIPFWVNQNIWFTIENKDLLRKKYNIAHNSFLVGSFQRDTEGDDLISPKLSKGPDQFVKILLELRKKQDNLLVILTGKRRNYVIEELTKHSIDFKYYEMVSFGEINELYNILDLYIVASRYEGGPQSILECGIIKTPIISTNVGIAKEILSPESIFNIENFHRSIPNIEIAYKNSEKFIIPEGFNEFNKLLNKIYEN